MRGARIRSGAYALAAFLGILAVILLGAELLTIAARTLKDVSEGWSAYQIAAAAHQPGLLYPAKDSLFINNDPPLFFFHGEEDELVPLAGVKAMTALLSEAGVPTGLYLVPKARHIGTAQCDQVGGREGKARASVKVNGFDDGTGRYPFRHLGSVCPPGPFRRIYSFS